MTEPSIKRQRTCISCGSQQEKVALYRIVRLQDGSVVFDATGRKPGRGAYVCSLECLRKAIAGKRFQRALKANVELSDLERIETELSAAIDADSKR
ncbi:MAG: YlxR family protein [Eggerthellaceae bacterium]|nr:YlxR family protein [Eggerthellaceae bacterium]